MEVIRSQKRTVSNDVVSTPTLPLYLTAPHMEVRLEEFELFAIDRLRGFNQIQTKISLLSCRIFLGFWKVF